MQPFIPEGLFPVVGTVPVTTSGGVTADYISVKNAEYVWIVVSLKQTVAHATVFAVERATAVAPTGNVAIATAVPIWYGNVTTSSNALTAQTAAVSYTMGGAVTGSVQIIFGIDPATLGGSYDVIGLTASDSSQATNFVAVTYWIKPRYVQATGNNISYIVD